MKCEGCEANLNYAHLNLTLNNNQIIIQCPVCRYIMVIVYNRRRQIWETEKQRDERRVGWRKLKYKVNPKLTEIAASYKENK